MLGPTLLHYRIIRKLGQGGMGEVYLAEDTKLERPVALKVLPAAVRRDPDCIARFKIEARAAAQLNHPHIATIYSVEEVDDLLFITMEYVDGQPLSALLPKDGLPLAQFFAWFVPLADALCHAHEHRVTHRDLKPGNLMVSKEGVPKILDFGLAQITRPEPVDPGEVDLDAPTEKVPPRPLPLTRLGAVLGTPAYMSPEQAEGQKTDARTDVFSFGVVLYEALTGRRPFAGDSYQTLVAHILVEEPEPVTRLKPAVPYLVGHLIKGCLQKDRRRRVQAMADVRRELEDVKREMDAGTVVLGAATGQARPARAWLHRWPVQAALAGLFIVIAVLATWFIQERTTPHPVRKFRVPMEGLSNLPGNPAISPDGTMVAYTKDSRLWIRDLDQIEPREIPILDSEGAARPFWSPQSDAVGYFDLQGSSGNSLKKVSAQGGPGILLCKLPTQSAGGATWKPNGMIIFASQSLYEVPAEGGEPTVLLQPDSTKGEISLWHPSMLPDGKSLVFMIVKNDGSRDLVVQAGDTRTRLLHSGPGLIDLPKYAPTGHLLYHRGSGSRSDIWAVPFSLSSLTVTGKPFLIAQDGSSPSVSADGTLVYRSGTSGLNQLVWVDRSGKVTGTIGQPQEGLRSPALSPDGQRVAVNADEDGNTDIWIHDVTRGTKTRLTSDPAGDVMPIWTPAGDQVAFESRRSGPGDIYLQAADASGAARPLATDPRRDLTPDWSRDGQYLVYVMVDPKTRHDLWYMSLTGERKPVPFLQTSFREGRPAFSPDGRYVAYQSDESGQYEIYVQPFPRGAGKWIVSVKGGLHPRWRGDEIFYVDVKENTLMGVKVDTRSGFRAEFPRQLFTGEQVRARLYNPPTDWQPLYDVAPDGQRFVVVQTANAGTAAITVVEHWVEAFKK